MTTATAQIDGRDVAMAFRAISTLRDRVLQRNNRSFEEYATLRVLAEGSFDTREAFQSAVARSLPADAFTVHALVEAMAADGLVTAGDAVAFTPSGRALYDSLTAEFAQTSASVYEGMDAGDVETAHRVLLAVRAKAEALAAA